MPGGMTSPAYGYATFAAIKLVGYTAAAYAIRRYYAGSSSHPLLVGAARTGIGLVLGAAYGLGVAYAGSRLGDRAGPVAYLVLFYGGLFPVRVVEWWLVIWVFVDRRVEAPWKGWTVAVVGAVLSYLLDIPAMIGFIATGGLWIC